VLNILYTEVVILRASHRQEWCVHSSGMANILDRLLFTYAAVSAELFVG
jgi:hypothetical protein